MNDWGQRISLPKSLTDAPVASAIDISLLTERRCGPLDVELKHRDVTCVPGRPQSLLRVEAGS
jgi:hypothetical protein